MSNFDPNNPANNPFGNNPYQPTGMNYGSMQAAPPVATAQLAGLGQRFLGAVLDSFLPGLFVLPGYGMMIGGVIASAQAQQAGGGGGDPEVPVLSLIGIALIFLGFILTLGIQIYLLATRSQTLGKLIMKTQIVDFETGQPADFLHCAILRILVNVLIASIPCVGAIYSIVDICYIFREDRRCIHDLIASTTVIDISNR